MIFEGRVRGGGLQKKNGGIVRIGFEHVFGKMSAKARKLCVIRRMIGRKGGIRRVKLQGFKKEFFTTSRSRRNFCQTPWGFDKSRDMARGFVRHSASNKRAVFVVRKNDGAIKLVATRRTTGHLENLWRKKFPGKWPGQIEPACILGIDLGFVPKGIFKHRQGDGIVRRNLRRNS